MKDAATEPAFDPLAVLHAAAYSAYNLALDSRDIRAFRWFKDPQPGDMVIELSTMFLVYGERFKARRAETLRASIGRLVEKATEPWHDDATWETVKGEYDKRPMQTVWYVKLLDGVTFRWENADFARVPESYAPWRVSSDAAVQDGAEAKGTGS
jgi:hypothetical protein